MTHDKPRQRLEIWGGVEPTINRVGARYFSQFDRSGHRRRLSDLDEFAGLGLRTLRFPILWEEIAPRSLDEYDWSAVDAPLNRLRELGIEPIAGLLHHGSGPLYTSLNDPGFPEKLATFASAVAKRYPWIDAYTPVNEPLTTARFSGLYGHWYPHGRDPETFLRCLISQCRAVSLAMRAIREVNPSAALVQTDDLGKTYSTPKLQWQADYENERRWTTWDLLTGKLQRDGAMWRDFIAAGVTEGELAAFQETPCPPEIIGVNHYITSERFLDENLAAHPSETHGGNGREAYADLAAVRVRPEGISGTAGVLREAWERYRLPLAVTEAHIGCTREEQLRWFMEVWRGAERLRAEEVDVRAVTAWSLLGAFDWNSLLTRDEGVYEPGAYDIRNGTPRPTAIARMVRDLATTADFQHPTLATPGWWRRTVRMLSTTPAEPALQLAAADECIPAISVVSDELAAVTSSARLRGRPIVITGANGRLAQGFIRAAELRGLAYRAFSHAELDATDAFEVERVLAANSAWAVINCAGYSRVDDAELNRSTCLRSNTDAAGTLARVCAQTKTQLATFSSDHVFDGTKREPYVESDDANALNAYGESKLLAEREVLNAFPDALVIRPGKVFASLEDADFLRHNLRAIARGERVRAANDIHLSAAYLPDLAHATLDLLIDGERGIWHLASAGAVTPEQLLIAAADASHLEPGRVEGVPLWRLDLPAPRAASRVLGSERGQLLPPLAHAIHRYCRESPEIEVAPKELLATS